MEDLAEQLSSITDTWDSIRDAVISNSAPWQAALPDSAPEMIDTTLATLTSLVSNVSETSRRGRALRLAESAAMMQLQSASQVLTSQVQRGQYGQFPTFCNHIAQAASALYGIYILGSKEGMESVKEACIQLGADIEDVSSVHQKLVTVEVQAETLSSQLDASTTKAEEHAESCSQFDEQAAAHLTAIQECRDKALTASTDAQSHKQDIAELAEQYELLKDNINESMKESDRASETLNDLSGRAEEVRSLLESLLPGGTAAGLAEAYKGTKSDIAERMTKQFKLFLAGLLALVTTILIGHWLLGPLPTDPVPLMVQLLARALMALPAVWFTWVCVRQYTYLSRLHTDYGFKEAVATSFEGFRRMMEELDKAPDKDLTAILSVDAIRIIGSDPDRLGTKHHGDDSPISHVLGTLMKRLSNNKKDKG